ncbi:radical SAM protein [Seleniivibrio woodruffii]|uniref:radical SAM protein n=1 Tax=Seleniivibrio woodruffii TaxID=1078050 RepID=UPI0026EDA6C5|nr:radical SAM protein [Seleniivibrio woodruffii]
MPVHTEPLYRPPSEAHSLIFQITHGCSYNKCAFCGMYLHKPFEIKPLDRVLAEISAVPDSYAKSVKKIFLADGDGVIYPTDGLITILDALNAKFPNLIRISSYCGPHAIMKKSADEWRELYARRLKLLYFGLESGNREVLKLMNKGMDALKVLPKVKEIKETGIAFSVMVILGGGGKRLKQEHIADTAKWVTEAAPEYLSFLTLFLRRKKDYFNGLEKPTFRDIFEESRDMIQLIEGRNIIFRSNHVSNFLPLEGRLAQDKDRLVRSIDEAMDALEARGQLDKYPEFYEEM